MSKSKPKDGDKWAGLLLMSESSKQSHTVNHVMFKFISHMFSQDSFVGLFFEC